MSKKENIVRYTAEEVAQMLARGESKTDWAKVKGMSQDEIERLADEEDGHMPEGWESTVILGLPPRKKEVHIRLDEDVLDWFKSHGAGYQTRINAVLRSFVQTRRQMEKTQDQRPAP
ncbi:MAG: BrnA antitoxin family protein [Methylomonas sp.]|jgi:uncharacterized protein (DUF4415 family)